MDTKIIAITALLLSTLVLETIQAKDTSEKPKGVICETITDCQELSQSTQAQIDDLELKKLSNLSKEERIQFIQLKKKLILLEESEMAIIQKTNQKIEKQNQALRELESKLRKKTSN